MLSSEEKRSIAALERRIEFNERRIRRLEVLAKGAKDPFWSALREELELTLKAVESDIKAMATGVKEPIRHAAYEAESRALGGQVRAYDAVLANVENAQDKIDRINEQIASDKADIRRIREGDRAASGKGGVV